MESYGDQGNPWKIKRIDGNFDARVSCRQVEGLALLQQVPAALRFGKETRESFDGVMIVIKLAHSGG